MPGTRPPLWDPILSFLHTFSLKSTCVGGPRPSTGNPGSATANSLEMSFCQSDLALGPMTLILKHDLDVFNMSHHSRNELSMSRKSNEQTDAHTHTHTHTHFFDYYCPCMWEGNVFILSVCVCVCLSVCVCVCVCLSVCLFGLQLLNALT